MAIPLVLLHPFPLDASFWDDLRAALPGDRLVLTPEFPGPGGSPTASEPSIVGFADAVAAQITADAGGRAIVCGCSMGGFVALSLVVRHPARVAGLVLIDTSAGADPPERRSERDAAIARIRAEGPEGYVDDFVPPMLSPATPSERFAKVPAIARRQTAEALVGALRALRDRPDRRPELGAISVPTMVIGGEHDPRTPPAAMRELANGIAGARLAFIPNAGHLPPIEAPAAVARHMSPFLDSIDAMARPPEAA